MVLLFQPSRWELARPARSRPESLPTRTAVRLALLASLVAARPVTWADDAPAVDPKDARQVAKQIVEALSSGRPKVAIEFLTEDAIAVLAAAPESAATVCSAAAVNALRSYTATPRVAALIQAAVEKLAHGAAETAGTGIHGERAVAFSNLLAGCQGLLRKVPVDPAPLREACDTLRRHAKVVPVPPAAWIGILTSMTKAASSSAESDDLLRWIVDEAAILDKVAPNEKQLGDLFARHRLDLGTRLLPDQPSAALPLFEKALPSLAVPTAISGGEAGLIGRYNLALTAVREAGSTLRVGYRTVESTSAWHMLGFRVPAYAGWKTVFPEKIDQLLMTVTRDRKGRDGLSLKVYTYNWWTVYGDELNKAPGGENLAGLSKRVYEGVKGSVSKVTRDVKSVTGRLSEKVADTIGFEVRGVDVDGLPHRYRDWYFKTYWREKQTLSLSLEQWGDYSDKDPELLDVLESVVELRPLPEK